MIATRRPVSELMQRDVVTLRLDDRLALADDTMRLGRVRHMPVLDGDRLVGIVSNRDLLAASLTTALRFEPEHRRAFMRAVEVREVMSKDVVSIGPDTPVAEAARLMLERKIGCLPVVKGEAQLVGLVTETDLLRAAYLGGEDSEAVVVETSETRRQDVSDWKQRLEQELNELRRIRDELRVRVHLARQDAKDQWEKLEKRFGELESHGKRLAERTHEPLHELAEASRHLVDELRRGYRELRGKL
jgi:CBS domain-containing protein